MQNILLGVCGSIACYKAAALVRQLRQSGQEVQVLLTPAASRLVGAATFRALSARPVLTDEWRKPHSADGMDHIAAARQASVLLVAPASADFIAKAAAGMADNLLLAAFLAAQCPKWIAPAMNRQMWQAAATQRNIAQLRADGVTILGPAEGEQACGEEGLGRMTEPQEIAAALCPAAGGGDSTGNPGGNTSAAPQKNPLTNKQIIISAGATAEPLDAMRVISNRSSGKMGFCLAQAAQEMGARVRLVAGQTRAAAPLHIPLRQVENGEEMQEALLQETATADWFFSAAAVADFRAKPPAAAMTAAMAEKPARAKGDWTLTLTPTMDILSEISRARPRLKCVAFAAQTGAAAAQEKAAREKMQRKGACYIALNDAADAGREDCQLTLLYDGGRAALPRQQKIHAARALLAAIVSHETSGGNR